MTLLTMTLLTMTLLLAAGCADRRDEQFRRLAQQALQEQSEQNQRLADQSQQIAEASRRLVEGDAQARRDLLEAQQQLNSELHAERARLNRQQEVLESERRDIAAKRQRDPVIAQAIGSVGLTLTCLLPLLLAAHVIHSLKQTDSGAAELGELLVLELAAEEPLLLPQANCAVNALEHEPLRKNDETLSSSSE